MDWKATADEMAMQHRVIPVFGEITGDLILYIKKLILFLNLKSQNEITLLIDSGGGKLDAALEAYDFIRSSNAPIKAVVAGDCRSAAVTILLACHKRQMLPNSNILVHHISVLPHEVCFGRNAEEVVCNLVRSANQRMEKKEAIYLKHTKLNLEQIRKLSDDGQYKARSLSAAESLEMGFIEEVIETFPMFAPSPDPSS